MKKSFVILLALVLLIPCLAGTLPVARAASTKAPIYMLNAAETGDGYNYLGDLVNVTVEMKIASNGTKTAVIHYGDLTGIDAVLAIRNVMKKRSSGFRYIRIDVQDALLAAAEDIVYFDSAVAPMAAAFAHFFKLLLKKNVKKMLVNAQ